MAMKVAKASVVEVQNFLSSLAQKTQKKKEIPAEKREIAEKGVGEKKMKRKKRKNKKKRKKKDNG